MSSVWIIAKRELASFFDSLTAYVLIVIFLLLSGFFTWIFGNNVFMIGQADLQVFFTIAYWTLFFFIPAVTMKTLAEENKAGTIELLMTKAITDWQIVTGKFLACLLLIGVTLACTITYYLTVMQLGNIDHGAVWGGYFGLLLMSAAYIAIGIFSSSLTNNQIVAFLISLSIGSFFHLIFDALSGNLRGTLGSILNYLSASSHFESISRGVIDLRDLVYFSSVTFLGLLLAQTMLSKRNWQD
ncbi:MAG: ABC transporter permease subunit [Flammeovirgaceae bacterium]|nr:ABC transporter permease subunit [Flammeovirgaceae bacterium]MDW8286770.1 ABC transporter permease subunit [Flammeovirgaceae bacterium]